MKLWKWSFQIGNFHGLLVVPQIDLSVKLYNHGEGLTRAFSWLKAPTTVKLGPRRNYHRGRAAIRHYANQTARPL